MEEKIFNGIGASPGIVIGRAYLLDRLKVVVAGQRIEEINVKSEVARFKKAVDVSRAEIEEVRRRFSKDLGKSHRYILDTHIMLLEDKMLVDARSSGSRTPGSTPRAPSGRPSTSSSGSSMPSRTNTFVSGSTTWCRWGSGFSGTSWDGSGVGIVEKPNHFLYAFTRQDYKLFCVN